jgi:hypothetical protein
MVKFVNTLTDNEPPATVTPVCYSMETQWVHAQLKELEFWETHDAAHLLQHSRPRDELAVCDGGNRA